MPIFTFDNPKWSSLSHSIPVATGEWGLPDDVSLGLLLDLTPARIVDLSNLPVALLCLSARPSNAFTNSRIATMGQLLMHTLSSLLALPNMGRGSVGEVLARLHCFSTAKVGEQRTAAQSCANDFYRRVGLDMLEPLPLQHEWQLFSGGTVCPNAHPLSSITLPDQHYQRLFDCGIASVPDLLELTWKGLDERVGTDAAEEILSAIVPLAAEFGHQRPANYLGTDAAIKNAVIMNAETRRKAATILAKRWQDVRVAEIDFVFPETLRALRRANIETISDLLGALDPLHPELYLDMDAFTDVWEQFCLLGLVEGDFLAERERRSERTRTTTSLDNVLTAWREFMKPSAWSILNARYGLEKGKGTSEYAGDEEAPKLEPTLGELAAEIGVTQEGARQILIATIKRLKASQHDYLIAFANTLQLYTMSAGGVISLRDASRLLVDQVNPGNIQPEGFCRLVFDASDLFVSVKRNAVYALASKPAGQYDRIIRQAHAIYKGSRGTLEMDALAEAVTAALFPPTGDQEADSKLPALCFIQACLNADSGLEDLGILPAETLLVRLLRQLGSPRHFTEITARLNETGWRRKAASVDYIHGRLVYGRDLFVHVSRGTYGLAEWGLEDQRTDRTGAQIPDLIIEFLEQRGVPVPREEIAAYVLSQKKCRDYSVMHRLFYDDRFREFEKHTYGLAKWVF